MMAHYLSRAMLYLKDVSKKYHGAGSYALDSISLNMKNGSVLGLAGLNGAGKTTAIKIAAGVLTASRGKVVIDGIDLSADRSAAIRNVGWVPENDTFDSHYSALDLMRYYCGLYGMASSEAKSRSEKLLERVGLGKNKRQRLNTYSLGMRKRFMVASALIADPRNLLLDESFNGLDPEGFRFLKNAVVDARNEGKSVLVSSHILSEMSDLADLVAIIYKGRVIKTLDRSEISRDGAKVIHVRVDRFDQRIIQELKEFGNVSVQNGLAVVFDPKIGENELEAVSRKLHKDGFIVLECKMVSERLEDQFFRIIEEFEGKSAVEGTQVN